MSMKNRRFVGLALLLSAACGGASLGAPWIEELPAGFYVTDLSWDGTAAAGNISGDGSYETFRWTHDEGVVPLGRASVPALGVGGGSPDISYDGDKVSALIVSSDYSMATLGLWTLGGDWEEAFNPLPSYVFAEDQVCSSAWGLSGNGRFVSGYYQRVGVGVQACEWSPDGTLIDLPTEPGKRGRANAASFDGSVAVGWEDQGLGPWLPTAWRSGVKYTLNADGLGATMAQSTNIDGSVVVGDAPDEYGAMKVAAIWRWNGAGYDEQLAGYLPQTSYSFGSARFTSVTDDGTIAVGSNNYAFNPFQGGDAIIWTAETGLMSGTDFMASLGLSVPEGMSLRDFQSISPDGSVIAAAGLLVDYGIYQTFLIHIKEPCPADLNNDRFVEDTDFVQFASAYDMLDCADPAMPLRCPADLNRDGVVDDSDFVLFAGAYDALLCP